MKIYMTGGNGYVGKALAKRGYLPLSCDVTDYNSVDREITRTKPDIVLHLAAKSSPDFCKEHYEKSSLVNFGGTRNVMEVCSNLKIPAVFFSTSQVWGGGWQDAFNSHSESSKPSSPANDYGLQKLTAESAVLVFGMKIIRMSHIFDKSRLASTLSDLLNCRPIDAPTFMKRNFIHLEDFATQVEMYVLNYETMPLILHLAGSKAVSHCDFWLEVCEQFGFDKNLVRGRRIEKDIPGKAKRPHNGGLDVSLSKKLGFPQFDYIDGIRKMKDES